MALANEPEYQYKQLKIRTMGKKGVIYSMFFDSMGELESFLTSDPPLNKKSFYNQMSEMADVRFAGPSLKQSIAFCLGGYEEGYESFMQLSKRLETINRQTFRQRKTITSFVGGRPNVPAYIAGAPKTMYRQERVAEKKLIHVFMNISYSKSTTEAQIRNRGILTLNLIRVLEQNDYLVDFRVFEGCYEYDEYFVCETVLKKPGQKLDSARCYYPMCGKSFLRRIMSRIKESMPFEYSWGMTYGKVADEKMSKQLMDIGEDSIYIGTPQSMGINGEDIYRDADAFLLRIGLKDKIKVPMYQETAEKQKEQKGQEIRYGRKE